VGHVRPSVVIRTTADSDARCSASAQACSAADVAAVEPGALAAVPDAVVEPGAAVVQAGTPAGIAVVVRAAPVQALPAVPDAGVVAEWGVPVEWDAPG
jgi:hypothetical protein